MPMLSDRPNTLCFRLHRPGVCAGLRSWEHSVGLADAVVIQLRVLASQY